MTNQLSISTLPEAAQLADLGLSVHPLCSPTSSGACGCGWGHEEHDVGKAPRTTGGFKDATNEQARLEAQWRSYPNANVGIALEASGLFVIGPDSKAWDQEFQNRGLPETWWVQSGGGEGHKHYYYRRPKDCPIARSCHPDEYDILTGGYAVAPPSLHKSGRRYTWNQNLPESMEDLPFAPQWAVAMLTKGLVKLDLSVVSVDGSQSPTVPDAYGLKWWNGEMVKPKPDGTVDRSATLYGIACQLAKVGNSVDTIAGALLDRDTALGLDKYTNRPDHREYSRMAEKAVADCPAHPLRPVQMAPMGRPT